MPVQTIPDFITVMYTARLTTKISDNRQRKKHNRSPHTYIMVNYAGRNATKENGITLQKGKKNIIF